MNLGAVPFTTVTKTSERKLVLEKFEKEITEKEYNEFIHKKFDALY